MKKENFKINLLGIYLLFLMIAFVFIGVRTYLIRPNDELMFSLIILACSGGLGGTIYSIRGFYQNLGDGTFNFENWIWWYIFRPVVSSIMGVFVYFLIVGGLL